MQHLVGDIVVDDRRCLAEAADDAGESGAVDEEEAREKRALQRERAELRRQNERLRDHLGRRLKAVDPAAVKASARPRRGAEVGRRRRRGAGHTEVGRKAEPRRGRPRRDARLVRARARAAMSCGRAAAAAGVACERQPYAALSTLVAPLGDRLAVASPSSSAADTQQFLRFFEMDAGKRPRSARALASTRHRRSRRRRRCWRCRRPPRSQRRRRRLQPPRSHRC